MTNYSYKGIEKYSTWRILIQLHKLWIGINFSIAWFDITYIYFYFDLYIGKWKFSKRILLKKWGMLEIFTSSLYKKWRFREKVHYFLQTLYYRTWYHSPSPEWYKWLGKVMRFR